MQISGAGEGGRMAGREPARPARAVAHEPFRPADRETVRTARTPQRAAAGATSRTGSETRDAEARGRPGETTAGTEPRDDRARQDRVNQDLAHQDRVRASDDARASARRDALSARDKAARDTSARDRTDHGSAARDAARSAQAEARRPASGTPAPAGGDTAQAEAVRTAAAAAGETDEAGDEADDEGTGEEADAAGAVPVSLLSFLAAPAPSAAAPHSASAPAAAATGTAPAGPGDVAADPVQPGVPGGDPRAAALLAEVASRGAGRRDEMPEGGASPAPDGLAGAVPSASAPQANGAEAAPALPAAAADTRPAVSVPATLSAVPIAIGMRALAGSNRFEIRLDPYELGRIDVRLDIDRQHGTVKAHLVVERPETLALLQRDAGSLQQALSQAGLTPGEAGLSFSLQDHGGNAPRDQAAGRAPDTGPAAAGPVEAEAPLPPLRDLGQRLGLDLRI